MQSCTITICSPSRYCIRFRQHKDKQLFESFSSNFTESPVDRDSENFTNGFLKRLNYFLNVYNGFKNISKVRDLIHVRKKMNERKIRVIYVYTSKRAPMKTTNRTMHCLFHQWERP